MGGAICGAENALSALWTPDFGRRSGVMERPGLRLALVKGSTMVATNDSGSADMSTQPYGQWSWVHNCDAEPNLNEKVAGLHYDGSVALPPEFARHLQTTDVLGRANRRFGTLLDFYEEEDVCSAEAVLYLAGAFEDSFRGSTIEGVVAILVDVLIEAAGAGTCLTFRL